MPGEVLVLLARLSHAHRSGPRSSARWTARPARRFGPVHPASAFDQRHDRHQSADVRHVRENRRSRCSCSGNRCNPSRRKSSTVRRRLASGGPKQCALRKPEEHWRGRIAAVSCCLWLVSGCVQGPDYVKPAVEVPPAYRFGELLPSTAQQPAWWNAYRDPYLDGLVREALANNRDLRIATARVDEFAAILAGTKSQAFPQVGYGLSGNRSRASEAEDSRLCRSDRARPSAQLLSASWEIDLWGRIRRETEAARANLLATEEARRGVTLTLISSVIAGYVTLLDLDAQLRVAVGHGGRPQEIGRAVRNEARRPAGSPNSKCPRSARNMNARCSRSRRSSRPSRHRNMRCRCWSGATPARSLAQVSRIRASLADRPRRPSFRALVPPAGHPPGRTAADRVQRADRRGARPVLPQDQPDRPARLRQRVAGRPVQRLGAHLVVHRRRRRARSIPAAA